ncbi:hypothetical protein PIB30_013844, partial [Stylosanthes scabra]|nr:hypothetical protein [Stylosanthes scabra]
FSTVAASHIGNFYNLILELYFIFYNSESLIMLCFSLSFSLFQFPIFKTLITICDEERRDEKVTRPVRRARKSALLLFHRSPFLFIASNYSRIEHGFITDGSGQTSLGIEVVHLI